MVQPGPGCGGQIVAFGFISLGIFSLFTGNIGNGLWLLLTHPDQRARLRDDPGLMPSAVEEMLRMESPQPQALERVEQTLQQEFMTNLARTAKRDTHEVMAEIFNNLDRATETRLMGTLEGAAAESAARVRALMFTFEDLRNLDTRSMQVLVRTVDRDKLPLALKSASGRLLELFLKSMSDRAGRILMDDIESLGPVLLRDVEAAQLSIVNKAKELSQQGEIRLGQGKDEAVLI